MCNCKFVSQITGHVSYFSTYQTSFLFSCFVVLIVSRCLTWSFVYLSVCRLLTLSLLCAWWSPSGKAPPLLTPRVLQAAPGSRRPQQITAQPRNLQVRPRGSDRRKTRQPRRKELVKPAACARWTDGWMDG
ncbi:hypothetical protein E2C01_075735 [Portunus trituberculatus]|uniref:Uncharacterized protein n=1 Tax=Portunus trituberculatus TaxID=210409 RepID=A0A5B7IL37_PORTR|nr:hypothetical protein [Portunus trituberculatus]